MDDFEDIDVGDDRDFQMEANAFERVGPSGKLSEILSVKLDETGKGGRKILPPEDRFYINTDAYCRRISEDNKSLGISQKSIDAILERASNTPNIRFKNYKGFVLGYIISNGGRDLEPTRVKKFLKDTLPELVSENDGIAPADVIRYARLWIS